MCNFVQLIVRLLLISLTGFEPVSTPWKSAVLTPRRKGPRCMRVMYRVGFRVTDIAYRYCATLCCSAFLEHAGMNQKCRSESQRMNQKCRSDRRERREWTQSPLPTVGPACLLHFGYPAVEVTPTSRGIKEMQQRCIRCIAGQRWIATTKRIRKLSCDASVVLGIDKRYTVLQSNTAMWMSTTAHQFFGTFTVLLCNTEYNDWLTQHTQSDSVVYRPVVHSQQTALLCQRWRWIYSGSFDALISTAVLCPRWWSSSASIPELLLQPSKFTSFIPAFVCSIVFGCFAWGIEWNEIVDHICR